MTKIKKLQVLFLSLTALMSCRLPNAEDYGREILQNFNSGMTGSFYGEFLSGGTFLYQLASLGGIFIFLYGLMLFVFHRKSSASLYLGISGLAMNLVYLSPLVNLLTFLPERKGLPLLIRTILLMCYYLFLRLWSKKTFHHRTKPWTTITRISFFALTYFLVALSWFKPALLSVSWAVPVLAVFVFADSSLCSLLSLKRKNDRSGIGGTVFSLIFASLAVFFILTSQRSFQLFRSLDDAFFSLPASMLLPTLILDGIMMQREIRSQRLYLGEYKIQTEEAGERIEQEEKRYSRLEKETEEALHIPAFHIAAARKTLRIDPLLPLSMPEGWEGAHFLEDSGTNLPAVGAWPLHRGENPVTDIVFFGEATREDRYSYPALQYIHDRMAEKTGTGKSRTGLFAELNREMSNLGTFPEHPLSAAMLQFTGNHLICSTAGTALIWYKKPGQKIQIISSKEIPATFQQGLGFKPYSRETGRPYRIPVEKGDTIVLTSRSFLFREQSMNGQIYGKDSLQRVLENHESGSAGSIMSSLVKDFDDFDMGNTRDRQFYVGIFKKA